MQDISFYQSHLDHVSRSFALVIPKLKAPMRHWTSLSYLLCRALDTIEDAEWETQQDQRRQYQQFEAFIQTPSFTQETMNHWSEKFSIHIPKGEKELLNSLHLVLEDLHQLPENIKRMIQTSVLRMSAGMQHYSSRETVLRLADLIDVNRYCYFVAGIVGELLTRFILELRPDFAPGPTLLKNSFHFGLFLQKVNLLKDQKSDEKEGRYLVPDRELLYASLKENAIGSFNYITAIPEDEKGYRTFCSWSLFLGLASLPWIQNAFLSGESSKIPRSVTQELLLEIERRAQDNAALNKQMETFLHLFPDLPLPTPLNTPTTLNDWFDELSGHFLDPSDLSDLRLIFSSP